MGEGEKEIERGSARERGVGWRERDTLREIP